jgi:diguanylate cyclase (GGDEF)-like protein/PAS domain S-box-containing protein
MLSEVKSRSDRMETLAAERPGGTGPSEREIELYGLLARTAESNAWLEMAEEIGQLGHWRLELPARKLTWSNQIYRIHGVTPTSLTPDLTTAIEFFHPSDRAIVTQAITTAIEQGKPYEFSARIVRRDGETRQVVARGVARFGPNGVCETVFGVLRDVTREFELHQALREANDRLNLIAHQDALTGLANRRRFDEALDREWRRAQRESATISLVMVDIDRFKAFNDRYGHPSGDACLQKVAGAVANAARRPGDLAARYGGEELVLLLPGCDQAGTERIANSVRIAIEALAIPHEGNPRPGAVVTASLGAATLTPPAEPTPGTPGDLVLEADRLLYEAKRTGRNQVVSSSNSTQPAPLHAAAEEATRLETFAAYALAGATRRNAELDRIARLAATLTGSPVALVSMLGADEQTFAGNFGLEHIDGTSRSISFCAHTINGDEPMVVADAMADDRFKENPLVTGEVGLRYYAGAPVYSRRNGQKLGALCVIDTVAHAHTGSAKRAILKDLANMAADLIEDAAARK